MYAPWSMVVEAKTSDDSTVVISEHPFVSVTRIVDDAHTKVFSFKVIVVRSRVTELTVGAAFETHDACANIRDAVTTPVVVVTLTSIRSSSTRQVMALPPICWFAHVTIPLVTSVSGSAVISTNFDASAAF